MFVLQEKRSKKYFVNPTFHSWDFTDQMDKGTVFATLEKANIMKNAVNKACTMTYWDWNDIVPEAIVVPFASHASFLETNECNDPTDTVHLSQI